jgi:uncharacterized membrane protein
MTLLRYAEQYYVCLLTLHLRYIFSLHTMMVGRYVYGNANMLIPNWALVTNAVAFQFCNAMDTFW